MKLIANYISVSRIIFSLSLFLLKPLTISFFIIYFICGVSDVLDGYLARKTKTESKIGARIDSIADLILTIVLFIILYPIIKLNRWMILWLIFIFIIRFISVTVVFIKYKTFGIMHTYGNKITGLLLFMFPILIAFIKLNIVFFILCIIATLSASEELLINIFSMKLDLNKKGII